MPRLTTHVLNQAEGIAGSGVCVVLELKTVEGSFQEIARRVTNTDGRLDAPLLDDDQPGDYRLSFMIGDYFATRPCGKGMLTRVPVEFALEAAGHYHIPLLVTPWAYSVYRGS
ncbi:hydroxyisourate hydrolase [Cobetia sp. L2A1]|uniref:hydroxyisourate hydrolase n=1 Tax=Cobetia sp. L2A1 TaxID=2686360 RepID=UPI00131E17A8|nr:hydroxyisourate hydrolase [Cobetia sp. L2A1]